MQKSLKSNGSWVVKADISDALNSHAVFEIAVVRADNAFGIASYGWFDENKLLISHNGGPCHWPLTQIILDKLLILAEEVAKELNYKEQKD